MDLTNISADRIEARPDWLTAAYTVLSRLPEDACTARAAGILLSIEADCIPAPEITRGRDGGITILFCRQDCSIEFIVGGSDAFQIRRFSSYERSKKTIHRGWPGNAARDAIRWLYPSSHSTVLDDKGIERVLREGL